MTVNRYATQAGKKFESDLTKHLRLLGWEAERLRLSGKEDEGDLLLRVNAQRRFVLEAKREKGFRIGSWVQEAQVERDHYIAHRHLHSEGVGWVVVHHARGKSIGDSYVTTTLDEWLNWI